MIEYNSIMKDQSFGYINIHTHYSLLNGTVKIPKIVKKAKELNCDFLALTDISNMYGAIDFYKECQKNKIKPILGVSIFIERQNQSSSHTLLLAKNLLGYKNLIKIINKAQQNTNSNAPCVSESDLINHSNGLIQIIPFQNSIIDEDLKQKNFTKASATMQTHKNAFGDDIYIGICPTIDIDVYTTFAKEVGIKTVLQHPVFYLEEEDKEIRDVVIRIKQHKLSNEEEELYDYDFSFYDLIQYKDQYKEAFSSLDEINTKTEEYLEFGNWIFPEVQLKHKDNYEDEFIFLIEDALKYKKHVEDTKIVRDRIKIELEIIKNKGYIRYFLAVLHIVQFMHKNNIPTMTRGSAAGSLIAYILSISNVDPLRYKIPFERFLNPYRPSAPDIDIDIADDKRNLVIDFISESFGKDRVAQIGTFGTMSARAVVRDVARALGHSYTVGDRIAKLIPFGDQGHMMTIDRALEESKDLREFCKMEIPNKILETSKKIEGNVRHISKHAAGVLITPKSTDNYIPVEYDKKSLDQNIPITQYNMHSVEELGLLKFDILGISYLAILASARDRVNKRFNKNIDLSNLPLDDKTTFDFLSDGNTVAVFQLGGQGLTQTVKKLQPENISDVAAIIALYRPGPIKTIDEYIARKNGQSFSQAFHPKMEPFLKDSYGLLVYQDDLLYTALTLANYTWKEVDIFRKAVGKKIPELMAEQEVEFKSRCVKHSKMTKKESEDVWELFAPFTGYGFNKAHAYSYAMISYQTAYMKANYTADYMAAALTSEAENYERSVTFFSECKKIGIPILTPNVNKSVYVYSVEKIGDKDAIRIGLKSIKNLGTKVALSIVEEREKGGDFINIENFLQRMSFYNVINKKSLEALVCSGSLDEFDTRATYMENIDLLLKYEKEIKQTKESLQESLFSKTTLQDNLILEKTKDDSKAQNQFWEKNLLGVYISGHPVTKYNEDSDFQIADIVKSNVGEFVAVNVVITKIKKVKNKKGGTMLFFMVEDEYESIEVACFDADNLIDTYEELIVVNKCVNITAKVSQRDDENLLILEHDDTTDNQIKDLNII